MRARNLPVVVTFVFMGALGACGDGDDGEAGAEEFCELATAAESAGDVVNGLGQSADPKELEDATRAATAAGAKAAAIAPDEIADAANAVVDNQEKAIALLDKAGFDFAEAAADPEFQKLASDPDVERVDEELDAYLERECGIEDDDDSAAEPPATDAAVADTATTVPSGGPAATEAAAATDDDRFLADLRSFVEVSALGFEGGLTDEQIDCIVDDLKTELDAASLQAVLSAGPDDETSVQIGLAYVGCGVDIDSVAEGAGSDEVGVENMTLDTMVTALLLGTGATEEQQACAKDGFAAVFTEERLRELFNGDSESTPEEDQAAIDALDQCGLDGAGVINGS